METMMTKQDSDSHGDDRKDGRECLLRNLHDTDTKNKDDKLRMTAYGWLYIVPTNYEHCIDLTLNCDNLPSAKQMQ